MLVQHLLHNSIKVSYHNWQQLFGGRPSLKKLQLWTVSQPISPMHAIRSHTQDNATFNDPLTIAEGRKQYQAQWYGLQAAFSEIEQLHHSVTSSGNPISMDLKTRYKIKGIGSEQTIESVVKIHTDAEGKRIIGVEDKWNNSLPEGPFAKVRPMKWIRGNFVAVY